MCSAPPVCPQIGGGEEADFFEKSHIAWQLSVSREKAWLGV